MPRYLEIESPRKCPLRGTGWSGDWNCKLRGNDSNCHNSENFISACPLKTKEEVMQE